MGFVILFFLLLFMFKIFTLKSLETELENNHIKHRLILRVTAGACWVRVVSTKRVNEQSMVGIEQSFIWVKLRTIARKTASQITRRNCSREAWFSVRFYVFSEQRRSNKSGIYTFKVSEKARSAHTQRVTMTLVPGKGVLLWKNKQWHPRKGDI